MSDRTDRIKPGAIIAFTTLRNEDTRLPYFLDYYRELGVDHFVMVDNESTDGGPDYLKEQPDVSLFHAKGSYKSARFGVDWLNWLQSKYGHGHWCLTVDPDEFLVYPFCDTRPLRALTDWLDASLIRSFGAMLLDMYPKGPVGDFNYARGSDPLDTAHWFDAGNYVMRRNKRKGELWIQGGPRARTFFRNAPQKAPALNKTPLVKWQRHYTWVSSSHVLLPRRLNVTYDERGGEKASGVLLHTKFLSGFADKAREELERREHYAGSLEYEAYATADDANPDLWCKWSEKYINWRQLEVLGIMSKGNWA